MDDAEKQYIDTIRAFNVKRFVKQCDEGGALRHETHTSADKRTGRTEHHKKFLRYRKQLKENLFIPYPFIRFILHSSFQCFPAVLNDYSSYRKTKSGIRIWLMLIEFEAEAQRDLENNSIFLREEWYPKIVQIILKYYRKRNIGPHLWPRMLNCAKGLINRQITEIKINTFNHIFDVLKLGTRMPPLKFYAICSNGHIELEPSLFEVRNTYKRIFHSIASVATKFPSLEPLIDRSALLTNETYMKIGIGEITFNQLLKRLEDELDEAYAPVLDYVHSLETEYFDLLSEDTRNDLDEFLSEPKHIDCYFEKVSYFQQFVEKLQKSTQNQIFHNAIINQSKALVGLRIIAHDYIDEIVDKLSADHKNNCQRICDWFANVQKRALEAPKSTETLLANGEFMLQMKNKKITEIREHIQNSLQVLSRSNFVYHVSIAFFSLQLLTLSHCVLDQRPID